MAVKKKDIPKMIADIESIRSLVEKKNGMFRRLDFSLHLRLVVLLMGLLVVASCLLMHLFLRQYGTFSAIPVLFRLAFFVATGLMVVSLSFMKIANLTQGARKIDPSYKIFNMIKEFLLMPPFLHSYIVWLTVLAALTAVIISARQYHLLVPMLSFIIAFMINLLGGLLERKIYLVTGYWLLVCGLLSLIFPAVPALMATAVSIGGGFILFGIVSYLTPTQVRGKRA